MLVDIFSALSSAAAKLSLSGVYEQPANEAASINLRQDAMAMLNDSDGKAMSNWIRVFDTDVALFRDMARDWVRTCRETDVFHLFDGGNSHADF
jgi:hypothetical protein